MSDLLVVFDIGSTLIHPDMAALATMIGEEADSVESGRLARAFAYAMEADQRTLPHDDQAARQGQELLRLLRPESRIDYARARNLWLTLEAAGGSGSSLYTILDPDAHFVLSTLRASGCRLIAASNGDGTLEAELRTFGIASYFDHLVDSHDIGVAKPDPRFFAHILSLQLVSRPVSTWYVGNDPIRDVLGALLGGFNRAALYDRVDAYPMLRASYRLFRLAELVPLISSQEARS